MINFRESWKHIAARIQGLEAAVMSFAETDRFLLVGLDPASVSRDRYQIRSEILLPALNECMEDVLAFRDKNIQFLPGPAIKCIERFEKAAKSALGAQATTGLSQIQIVIAFTALKTELTYHLADNEIQMKRLVERSFTHLRRRIIVDKEYAQLWQAAYNTPRQGEPECEKLGAVHLLTHGIWAFKSHAEKERTDLILGISLDEDEVKSSADALILTEWKRVDKGCTQNAVDQAIEDGIKQAKIYSGSSLAGYEIHTVRYIPIVSWERKPVRDRDESGLLYRVINIPVNPEEPSKAKAA